MDKSIVFISNVHGNYGYTCNAVKFSVLHNLFIEPLESKEIDIAFIPTDTPMTTKKINFKDIICKMVCLEVSHGVVVFPMRHVVEVQW